jgi:hypothetical protein
MQYFRMLTNSLMAGALVGAYVSLLVLQLNPMVQLNSMAVARLVLTWSAFYGVHATAFFYGLIVLRQLLAVSPARMGQPPAIAPSGVRSRGAIVVAQPSQFRSVLSPDASSRIVGLSSCRSARPCFCLALLQAQVGDHGTIATCCQPVASSPAYISAAWAIHAAAAAASAAAGASQIRHACR